MPYPSDLNDQQWDTIKDHFHNGNRAKHPKRILMNAVLYLVKTGCQWRFLPRDFPHWKTVYSFYRRMCKANIWEKILNKLVIQSRELVGKEKDPTFCIIDSQSVKTNSAAKERGIDGGKKNKRKKKTHSY